MNDPKHTHAWAQFIASAREMASALGVYRKELREQGFSEQESLALVYQLQQALSESIGRGGDDSHWEQGP